MEECAVAVKSFVLWLFHIKINIEAAVPINSFMIFNNFKGKAAPVLNLRRLHLSRIPFNTFSNKRFHGEKFSEREGEDARRKAHGFCKIPFVISNNPFCSESTDIIDQKLVLPNAEDSN